MIPPPKPSNGWIYLGKEKTSAPKIVDGIRDRARKRREAARKAKRSLKDKGPSRLEREALLDEVNGLRWVIAQDKKGGYRSYE